jgi:hypothetical protein
MPRRPCVVVYDIVSDGIEPARPRISCEAAFTCIARHNPIGFFEEFYPSSYRVLTYAVVSRELAVVSTNYANFLVAVPQEPVKAVYLGSHMPAREAPSVAWRNRLRLFGARRAASWTVHFCYTNYSINYLPCFFFSRAKNIKGMRFGMHLPDLSAIGSG